MEDESGATSTTTARWLYLGSGYYDYEEPYDAHFPGRREFEGPLVHPQFWPKDFDYAGNKFVVTGSGATAVSIGIGRASSRERGRTDGSNWGVAASLKKKKT